MIVLHKDATCTSESSLGVIVNAGGREVRTALNFSIAADTLSIGMSA